MNFIDTHSHLTHPYLADSTEKVIKDAEDSGVSKVITCGITLKDSQAAVQLAQKYDSVYAAVGIHPTEISSLETDFRDQLFDLARMPKVVAIGEIGLDYYWEKDPIQREKQKVILRSQLGTAVQLDLPVIIHNREADEVYDELERYKVSERLRGVVHCFMGGVEEYERLKKLNFKISFTGSITSPNLSDETLDLLKNVDLADILIETDSPFISIYPEKIKPNSPRMVVKVAEKIAEIRGIELNQVSEITTRNAIELFNL